MTEGKVYARLQGSDVHHRTAELSWAFLILQAFHQGLRCDCSTAACFDEARTYWAITTQAQERSQDGMERRRLDGRAPKSVRDTERRSVVQTRVCITRKDRHWRLKLIDSETRWSIWELELGAVVWACRPYLRGVHFELVTDSKVVAALLTKDTRPPRRENFIARMMEFDFTPAHRKGELLLLLSRWAR